MKRQKWSHSNLVKITQCGERYRREQEEKTPVTPPMARGSVVHEVVAFGHTRQKLARQESPKLPKSIVLREALPSDEEVADEAATRFENIRKLSGITAALDPQEGGAPPAKIIGRAKDAAIAMSRYYIQTVAPFVDPINVEKKVIAEPDDMPIRISGIFDLETLEPDGRRAIRDIKTKEGPPREHEARDSDQLSMYALLDRLRGGVGASVFALDFIVKEKRRLYTVSQTTSRSDDDIQVTIDRVLNAVEVAKAGAFLANGPGHWSCSPRWCPFWSSCKFVRRQ